MKSAIAIDIETTGLDWRNKRLLGMGWYSPAGSGYTQSLSDIRNILADSKELIAHNAPFEFQWLNHLGLAVPESHFVFDPKIATALLRDKPTGNALDQLAGYYLGEPSWKDMVDQKNMEEEEPATVAAYCIKDCEMTYRLAQVLSQRLQEEEQHEFYTRRLLPLSMLLARATLRGFNVDPVFLGEKRLEYERLSAKLQADFKEKYRTQIAGFEAVALSKALGKLKLERAKDRVRSSPPRINLNSPDQTLELLTDFFGARPTDRDGKPSAGKDALLAVSKSLPVAKDILAMRSPEKLLQFCDLWIEAIKPDNRVHSNFNVDRARTGRLSAGGNSEAGAKKGGEPTLNIQNVPTRTDKSIRKCFIPSPGNLLVVKDLSQIEPRLIAHYSKDRELSRVFTDDVSLYGLSAVKIGLWDGDPNKLKEANKAVYNAAKTIVLGILYGMGGRSLSQHLFLQNDLEYSPSQCQEFISRLWKGFPGLRALNEASIKRATERGFLINLFGRKAYVPKGKEHMTAMNTLIQGSASDFMCFLQLFQRPALSLMGGSLVALVHDEQIWEFPADRAFEASRLMDKFCVTFASKAGIRVPVLLEGGVRETWGSPDLTPPEKSDSLDA